MADARVTLRQLSPFGISSYQLPMERDEFLQRLEAATPSKKRASGWDDPRKRGRFIESLGPQLIPTPITEGRRHQPSRRDPWVICCRSFSYHDPSAGPQQAIAGKSYMRCTDWVVREHFWNFAFAPWRPL